MAVLFVSHASKDDAAASGFESWLHANGFTDVFVDHHGIAGGEKWAEALRASVGSCRVVVCLITPHWLRSHDCFNEFLSAWYLGKRIMPLFLAAELAGLDEEAQRRLARVRAEYQGIDVSSVVDAEGHLDPGTDKEVSVRLRASLRAAGAMTAVGLDPEAFDIDRARRAMPFPGLVSFGDDDADAALFYGRSREIADTLEELRKMRAEGDRRPFVILGASGAGKSSLLKAGIIPRLRREAPAWLPLRAFRPGADPLLNFAEALTRTLAEFGVVEAHGAIRDRMFAAWSEAGRDTSVGLGAPGLTAVAGALAAEGERLRRAAGRPNATILISVDQAEEMARADGVSGEALADYLSAALAASGEPWQLAFTIRTDSFPELQGHRRFQNLQARGYDLRAIPVVRFDSVVEQPARRYGVSVDLDLVDALMDDAPKSDSLPLLAFALQRLWNQYAASGRLAKDNYDRVGRLTGLIEDAAERALRGIEPEQDVPLPSSPPPRRVAELGASTFVPGLVQINDQGATIRRVAVWQSFDDEQQDFLARFDRWRLVVRKGGAGGGSVEVAHEALFREWKRLNGWLEPERARLDALRSLEVDAATWARNGRDPIYLNHRGRRLAEAETLAARPGYRERLGPDDLDYVTACRTAELRARRRSRLATAGVAVLAVGVAGGLAAWWQQAWIANAWFWFTDVRPYVLTAAEERDAAPGDPPFQECTVCPKMVVVPAGKFGMGETGDQHPVTITRPFAVSRFEITFAEWDACVVRGGCPHIQNELGWGRGSRPVIYVNWHEAKLYTTWLSTITGSDYRLLSESEWEYAARAGTEKAYWWGDAMVDGKANCDGCGSDWDDRHQAAPVDDPAFEPNPFGLFHMSGNVWEWVEDCWHSSYDGAPDDGSAWTEDCVEVGGFGEGGRVVRGGSWNSDPEYLRSAYRLRYSSGGRDGSLGFRVGRTLDR